MDKILDEYITVGLLGSGFTAVHRVLIKENENEPYWDTQQTGIGRYKNKSEAEIEAISWAESEGIGYRE